MRWLITMIGLVMAAVLTMLLSSCAGKKNVVATSYCYLVPQQLGIVQADDAGTGVTQPDSTIVIYVVTTHSRIQWDSVWIGAVGIPAKAVLIKEGVMEAGTDASGAVTTIRTAAGQYLYQLQLPVSRMARQPAGVVPQPRILFRVGNRRHELVAPGPKPLQPLLPV